MEKTKKEQEWQCGGRSKICPKFVGVSIVCRQASEPIFATLRGPMRVGENPQDACMWMKFRLAHVSSRALNEENERLLLFLRPAILMPVPM